MCLMKKKMCEIFVSLNKYFMRENNYFMHEKIVFYFEHIIHNNFITQQLFTSWEFSAQVKLHK